MSTTTNLLTWEAFEQLPDSETHKEVLEGELIELPPAKPRRSIIAAEIIMALGPYVKARGLGRAYLEAGYQLSKNPPTWIQPDASFLCARRVREADPDNYFTGAPDLAIEVISPSDRARDMQRKIALLLAGGALAVWVVYPEQRNVRVFSPGGRSELRVEGDSLALPELIPGFELPVAKLFED